MTDSVTRNPGPLRSLVLIGPMLVGKSTVGRRVSYELGLPFFDSDAVIESTYGRSVTELFAIYGEDWFRQAEAEAIRDILNTREPVLLAVGGGAVMNDETAKLLAEAQASDRLAVIYLHARAEQIRQRILKAKNRPLLVSGTSPASGPSGRPGEGAPDASARWQEIAMQREPRYRELADVVVMVGDKPLRWVADQVIAQVCSRSSADRRNLESATESNAETEERDGHEY